MSSRTSSGRTLRALMVGIDAYRGPVPSLAGCVADVETLAELLGRRAEAAGDAFDLLLLRDGEATRQSVIDAFRSHLASSGPDDTALFYYSGHGSQEQALPEHMSVEPDGMNETLVLVDSRDAGRWDLADKELAQLVGEVSKNAGHVLVILDCCHSGSGVRALLEDGLRERRAPTDDRTRPAQSYVTGTREIAAGGGGSRADWLNAPGGNYVLLAACRSDQTAKEIRVGTATRGAFSAALERVLVGMGGEPTYLDVQQSVSAAVRNLAADQSPVLEAPVPADASRPFLGGLASPSAPVLTASFVNHRGWMLRAGRLHGLDAGSPSEPPQVVLYPLRGPAVAVTTARVAEVSATSALLIPAAQSALDRGMSYRAVIETNGQPRTTVSVTGATPAAETVRARLNGSAIVRLADGDDSDLVIEASGPDIRVVRPGARHSLAATETSMDEVAVNRTVLTCEHIGRWLAIASRTNPTTRLSAAQVALTVHDEAGDAIDDASGAIEVAYTSAGEEGRPVIKISYANNADVPLHCAVLALSELYGVECLTTGGSVLLQPGQTAWVPDTIGQPKLQTHVEPGQDRTTDRLKLLASTEDFDAQTMRQRDLEAPTRTVGARATRGIGPAPTLPAAGPDWTTKDVLVTTVRPGRWTTTTPGAPGTQELGPGVLLFSHPGVSARARLASRQSATRDALVSPLPPALLAVDALTEEFTFGSTRSVGSSLSILELDDVANAESVTRGEPLRLRVEDPLPDGQLVLPIAYDGEDYLPLGHARTVDGSTELVLERLPAQTAAVTKSLGGSLKILFRKLVLRRLGADYPYPLLSLVTQEAGTATYVHDRDRVAEAVRDAQKVLLVVHGIIGDTRGMVGALTSTPHSIRSHYDAVLALDYENLNTPVAQTAAELADKISNLGLGQGQRIDVLSHSMGGLLSRWWIEEEGGHDAVRRLVTCGTPHAGSPWPRVQDVATSALALAVNGLGGLLGPSLAFLVKGVEGIDDALDDMTPGSGLLRDLARHPAPDGVDYVAIAGDMPFGPASSTGRARRILTKLMLPSTVLGMLFGRDEHDVAVSVPSATAVGRHWSQPPERLDADCSHMTYFNSPEGIATIATALAIDGPGGRIGQLRGR